MYNLNFLNFHFKVIDAFERLLRNQGEWGWRSEMKSKERWKLIYRDLINSLVGTRMFNRWNSHCDELARVLEQARGESRWIAIKVVHETRASDAINFFLKKFFIIGERVKLNIRRISLQCGKNPQRVQLINCPTAKGSKFSTLYFSFLHHKFSCN